MVREWEEGKQKEHEGNWGGGERGKEDAWQ